MKSLKSIAIALMAFGALAAQGADVTPSNRYITRKVNSGAFTAIRTNTSLDIVYTVGPLYSTTYADNQQLTSTTPNFTPTSVEIGCFYVSLTPLRAPTGRPIRLHHNFRAFQQINPPQATPNLTPNSKNGCRSSHTQSILFLLPSHHI